MSIFIIDLKIIKCVQNPTPQQIRAFLIKKRPPLTLVGVAWPRVSHGVALTVTWNYLTKGIVDSCVGVHGLLKVKGGVRDLGLRHFGERSVDIH